MTKHTEAPWKIFHAKETLAEDGVICETGNGWEIRPSGGQRLNDEMADLKLIAMAPDMLRLLNLSLELLKDNRDDIARVESEAYMRNYYDSCISQIEKQLEGGEK